MYRHSPLISQAIQVRLLYSHNHDTYTCRNKINNNDERTHLFRKIYHSHFMRNAYERVAKGLCVRGELKTEQTATYWPPVPLSLAALLSRSAGLLNRGPWGPIALCWVLVLSTVSYLQLNWLQTDWTSCRTGLCHCLTSTCFLWASNLHPIQPVHNHGYTSDIFDRMHLFLHWRLGRSSICCKMNWWRSRDELITLSLDPHTWT